MGRMTGVVMEQEGTHVVVLTSTGEFKKIHCRGNLPEIGEEITISAKPVRRLLPRVAWIAAAAAVFLMAFASPLSMFVNQPPEKAVAWVTVDINPSVELTVSDRDRVLEATALNKDGKKILTKLNLIGKDPEMAIAQLTNEATKQGYIKREKDNSVLISVASNTEKYNSQKLEEQLVAAAQTKLLEQQLVAVVQTVKVTEEFREQAKKIELSTGKYAVLIEAVNSGVLISEEDIKEHSVTEAIKKAGGKPEEILQKAHEEKVEQLPAKEQKYLMIAGEIKRTNPKSGVEGEGGISKPNDKPTEIGNPAVTREDQVRLMIPGIGNRGAEIIKPGTTPTEPIGDPVPGEQKPAGDDITTEPLPKDDFNGNTDTGNFRERDNSLN